jgi:hypothetical protein
MEIGKSLKSNMKTMNESFRAPTPMPGKKERSKSNVNSSTLGNTFLNLFQENEDAYNFYDEKKEGLFTKNEKNSRFHLTDETLITMTEKITTLHNSEEYLYVGTGDGKIYCYEIQEVQEEEKTKLKKKEISIFQTSEKETIEKIEVDEACSLLFFLSAGVVTILHSKTLILKTEFNASEKNKGAYTSIERGEFTGGLRSGSISMFTLDSSRVLEKGSANHKIAIFGSKSKYIDIYKYVMSYFQFKISIGKYRRVFTKRCTFSWKLLCHIVHL